MGRFGFMSVVDVRGFVLAEISSALGYTWAVPGLVIQAIRQEDRPYRQVVQFILLGLQGAMRELNA